MILKALKKQIKWPWWPLLPLYPYGQRKTIFKELIPNKVWCFDQLQGTYYVAIPIRLIVAKVNGGLMLFNPLPPTEELLNSLKRLEDLHGPVKSIVLPTASGLEHKIPLPFLLRFFPDAKIWICPGQWSFPLNLPLEWIGIPKNRTNILFADGLPHKECCDWITLGPLDIGPGRFQEISCFHKLSNSLLVTDALVAIASSPPEIFDFDPTPLLFHARDRGDMPLEDSDDIRRKGWSRIVLFASFLRPKYLDIPSLSYVLKNAFKRDLFKPKAHFGLYPFDWKDGWETSTKEILGEKKPKIQIAPVIERLVFPRAKIAFSDWLNELKKIKTMKWLISSHYSSLVVFSQKDLNILIRDIKSRKWAIDSENWGFLGWLDKKLLKLRVVPKDPLRKFRD